MKILRAHQIELSDEMGRVRIRLTASSEGPQIELVAVDGKSGLTLAMDDAALSSVSLVNPQNGPNVIREIVTRDYFGVLQISKARAKTLFRCLRIQPLESAEPNGFVSHGPQNMDCPSAL